MRLPADKKIKAFVIYLPSEDWIKNGANRGNFPQLFGEVRGRAEVTKLNRWLDEMRTIQGEQDVSKGYYELREVEITIGSKVE